MRSVAPSPPARPRGACGLAGGFPREALRTHAAGRAAVAPAPAASTHPTRQEPLVLPLTELSAHLPRTEELLGALELRTHRAVQAWRVTMAAFAMGMAVGTALGLLVAPEPGREPEPTGERTGRARDN